MSHNIWWSQFIYWYWSPSCVSCMVYSFDEMMYLMFRGINICPLEKHMQIIKSMFICINCFVAKYNTICFRKFTKNLFGKSMSKWINRSIHKNNVYRTRIYLIWIKRKTLLWAFLLNSLYIQQKSNNISI